MATCSPSQKRQLVLMESMNRRLGSILESQKKLEEKNATLQQGNVKLRSELSKQERLNNTKRSSKSKLTESKVEVPMDLRVGLRTYCFDVIRKAFHHERSEFALELTV